jgi:hypothetical protein
MLFPSSRHGTFLLMCMALVATLTVLAFAFLRTVQQIHTSGDSNTRNLLAREAALEGFQHAAENLMRAYVSDDNNPVGPGFTRMETQGFAPFLSFNGAYIAGGQGAMGATTAYLDFDDVAPEHHLYDPMTVGWWCGYDGGGMAWRNSATNNDGRGRYYEPSFYDLLLTNSATAPTVPVPFSKFNLGFTPDRSDGLFLDAHFVRIPSSTPVLQARQLARFRQRYAVDIMDLDGQFLANGDPGLDYTHIVSTDPNDPDTSTPTSPGSILKNDPVARRVIADMEAVPQVEWFMTGGDMGSASPLRMQHVYQGRGWTSNFDWDPTTHTPQTFPLMWRAQNTPIFFLSGAWPGSTQMTVDGYSVTAYNWGRPNPPPEYAPYLFSANGGCVNQENGPLGLKGGGEAWPTNESYPEGGIIMNHVQMGPNYSFRNLRMASYGGEGNVTDYRNEGGIGFNSGVEFTPFGKNLIPTALQGSASYTAGGTTITGTNTIFSSQIKAGDVVSVGDQVRVIASVSGNQSASVTTAFTDSGTNAAIGLVSHYGSSANAPFNINILTAEINLVNGILAGYCPAGVMKQLWIDQNNRTGWTNGLDPGLWADMSATAPFGVSDLTFIEPGWQHFWHNHGDYFSPGFNAAANPPADFPIYYNPVEIRFTGGSPATEASATACIDASIDATDGALASFTISEPGSYSSTPAVAVVQQFESNATWDLFVPALSKAFGPNYGNYTEASSTDAVGAVIDPDFHEDYQRPADPRMHIPWPSTAADISPEPDNSPGPPYLPHPNADPGFRSPANRYPGPLAINGFDDDDNPRHDRLGRFIMVSDQLETQDPYNLACWPGGQFFRVFGGGAMWSPPGALNLQYNGPPASAPPAGFVFDVVNNVGNSNQPTQYGIYPEQISGSWNQALSPHPDSFYTEMLYAMANAIATTRAMWAQYPQVYSYWGTSGLFYDPVNNVWNGWQVGTNNNRVENLHDLDALFLANLGIDINNPGNPVVYTGPVHFTNGDAPRPGGWIGWYGSLQQPYLPPVNIAMLANMPVFHQTIRGLSAANDPLHLVGTTATGAQLTQTMELMLNDFRLSVLGSNPGYQETFQALDFNGDGKVCCSAFPSAYNPAASVPSLAVLANPADVYNYNPTDSRFATASATEAALHIDQVVAGTEPPFSPSGSATSTGGAVTLSSDANYIPFCISGNFGINKSKFYRVIVRGSLWDNIHSQSMSEALLDSVLCIDPADEAQEYGPTGTQHPARQYSNHVIYQRWWFDKYRALLSRSY